MPALNTISIDKLHRLIGVPQATVLLDGRTEEDFALSPSLIPGSLRRPHDKASQWASELGGRSAIVICHQGLKLGQGVAAWLRHSGIDADALEGGYEAWANAKMPVIKTAPMPRRDAQGRTVWVTRSRPKVDRIACPWLIRRFIDPTAVFLFVNPSDVPGVAERFNATPFDVEGVFWSHRGDTCTFDTMLTEFGLSTEPLNRLAMIVRGADTSRMDLAPEAAGLLAVSLGLSRMYADDLQQLEAGMLVYDALYRWCRDATDETHNWHSAPKKKS